MTEFSIKNKPVSYKRRATKTVWVGGLAVGGQYPIRVQSMATADTKDTAGVMREMVEMVDAGCEIVRVTVPTQADCDNLPNIRSAMKKEGIKVPLVADIHFTPSVALKCVEFVDKVRINPGNFVDKKLFQVREYTDAEYAAEMVRIREKFLPLVLKCKEYGVAMRIGTNHGSLSDRIMNRFGDTPLGMVESALEFLRICEEQEYRNIILSMKASNVQVMTAAYRLLAQRLDELGWNYPFHLGVTEAGEGEDGRIKSAIGIGALLEDGIGDTIRVSLTEDPVFEVPVAYELVRKYNALQNVKARRGDPVGSGSSPSLWGRPGEATPRLYQYTRRPNRNFMIGQEYHGEKHLVRVWAKADPEYSKLIQEKKLIDTPLEGIEFEGSLSSIPEKAPALSLLTHDPKAALEVSSRVSKIAAVIDEVGAVASWKPVLEALKSKGGALEWVLNLDCRNEALLKDVITSINQGVQQTGFENSLFSIFSDEPVYAYRTLAGILEELHIESPIHLRFDAKTLEGDPFLVQTAVALGTLLLDGLGDSLQIEGADKKVSLLEKIRLSYNILQGCRLRISKTEYISCPSCGRTLFNLQTTTDKIREKTGHLKGVKIAVMGCIVNGPGEMADADFGYVGTGPKKVSLYVGKECVERNIPEEKAVGRLIELIKDHNRWIEAPTH